MKLRELFDPSSCRIIGSGDVEIKGLSYDSRTTQPQDLFFCIQGTAADGNRYAADAVRRGAGAIMSTVAHPDLDVPQVIVPDDRKGMAEAACAFHGHPARKMRLVGITGTNGKTTTTHMIKRIAEHAGMRVGLIGTICNMIGPDKLHAERTTPESPDLQELLDEMAAAGCDLVVMEVSSHALAMDRVHGMRYDVGIFSNLTQDHLDFHGTFEKYAAAKELLFAVSGVSLINADDPAGGRMQRAAAGEVVTYGIGSGDLAAGDVHLDPDGVRYTLQRGGEVNPVRLGIPGRFSVYNSLAAAGAALALGIPLNDVLQALETMPPVAGRIELLDTRGQDFSVILDYAHTPDSLENVLQTVRGFARGRVMAVFGCGGNRDAGKRPLMGEIAARYADRLYVTSDNPRFEEPLAIMADIEAGIPSGTDKVSIENRRAAIRAALEEAGPGDVIVLAGKGHEDYQEIRGVKHPFDEKVVVAELLDELGF